MKQVIPLTTSNSRRQVRSLSSGLFQTNTARIARVLDDNSDDDDDDDNDEALVQPVHFRECLRLFDTALTANNPPILPPWCASEHIGSIDDPMLCINGHQRCLALPLNKSEARRLIRRADTLPMKIDLVDDVSVTIQINDKLERIVSYVRRVSCRHRPINCQQMHFAFEILNGRQKSNHI
jgi:hypothetical protein